MTAEKLEQIKTLWPHHSLTKIAAALGMNKGLVWYWAHKLGLPKKPKGTLHNSVTQRVERAVALRAAGVKWEAIAAEVGYRSGSAIHHAVKRRMDMAVGVDLVGVTEKAVGVDAWGSRESGVGDPPR